MATQPGLIEALLAQLAEFTEPVTTAVMLAYGTDGEVLSQDSKCVLKREFCNLKSHGIELYVIVEK
jgi:hypothetical protein